MKIPLILIFSIFFFLNSADGQSYDTVNYAKNDCTIDLARPMTGQYLRLPGICYDCDFEGTRYWDTIVKFCNLLPYCVFEVGCFTDCRAGREYNISVSEARADRIRDSLVAHGFEPLRLTVKGYGESMPLNRCTCENNQGYGMDCTENQHQQNRRTELKIVKILTKKDLWDGYISECTINPLNPERDQYIKSRCLPGFDLLPCEKLVFDSIIDLLNSIPCCKIGIEKTIDSQFYLLNNGLKYNDPISDYFHLDYRSISFTLPEDELFESCKEGSQVITIKLVQARKCVSELWKDNVLINTVDPYHPETGQFMRVKFYWDCDYFGMEPESYVLLDSIFRFFNINPHFVFKIEIGEFSDCRASFAYNDTLTKKRAESNCDYLIFKGYYQQLLVPVGYGERQLLNHCSCEDNKGPGMDCTENEHSENRRTELKIIGILKK